MGSMMRFPMLFILLTITFSQCPSQVFGKDNPTLSPLPKRILGQIFRDGLIETSAEKTVWSIANHFARRTRFAGKVRLNKVPIEGALNIYIFRHAEAVNPILS